MFDCAYETETTDHLFLRLPFFTINRQKKVLMTCLRNHSLRNLKTELLLDILL